MADTLTFAMVRATNVASRQGSCCNVVAHGIDFLASSCLSWGHEGASSANLKPLRSKTIGPQKNPFGA